MIGGDGGGRTRTRLSIGGCPDCSSTNLQHWAAKHPCPKCGEHMIFELQS